jgi:uncharacterized protein with HEPN domain
MSQFEQRVADYLVHMLQAIERINSYTEHLDEAAFLNSELVQDAVIRNLEVLGEAGNNIQRRYPDFAAVYPQLPLASAYQMRNAIAHGYFKVDYEIVWKTIHTDLPALSAQISKVLADLA